MIKIGKYQEFLMFWGAIILVYVFSSPQDNPIAMKFIFFGSIYSFIRLIYRVIKGV